MPGRVARWVLVLALSSGCADDRPALVLATTTSVQDSGLLDELLPTDLDRVWEMTPF